LAAREALGRDWPERGPRATDSHRGQCPKGDPGHQDGQATYNCGKWELLRAFPEGQGAELELSCPCSELSVRSHTFAEVLLEEETRCVSYSLMKSVLSEEAVGYKKTLPCLKITSSAPQTTLGLLSLRHFQLQIPYARAKVQQNEKMVG
jgi:hypothetical protein